MKHLNKVCAIIVIVLLQTNLVLAQEFKVIGYLPVKRFDVLKSIELEKLSHVNLAFAVPDEQGKLTTNGMDISPVVQYIQAAGKEVFIALAGASSPLSDWEDWISPAQRSSFIGGIVDYVNAHNLQGVDVDLEWGTINADYSGFVLELRDSLKAHNLGMSAALPGTHRYPQVSAAALDAFDWVNLMVYDMTGPWAPNKPGPHSPYATAEQAIVYWEAEGLDKARMTLGVPFYGYDFTDLDKVTSVTFGQMVGLNKHHATIDEVGQIYYNGVSTIVKKTQLALREGLGGMMIWELGQDDFGEFSLLDKMSNTIEGYKARELAGLNDSGEMPFELSKEKIIIPVRINGKVYRFLVDTGGIFEVSEELQKELGFAEVNSTTIVDINLNEIELKTVVVPEVKIGNWAFKNRKAIVSDLPDIYPYSCFEVDGMIGRDFFDKVLLHFDYANKIFRLTEDTDAIDLDESQRTKMRLSKRGLPDVKLSINGKKEYIEFDAGSGDFYSPKTSDVERKLRKNPDADILAFQGEFSFGITMDNIKPTYRYREKIETFGIANAIFNDFYTEFSKVSAPRIGAGILKYGKVTLDYKNGWFYYQVYAENQVIEPLRTFGFDIAIENGGYKVKYVLQASEAEKGGLRSGSKITMIDDFSTVGVPQDCEGYLTGYAFKKKEKIKVEFLDAEGKPRSITLQAVTHH